MWWAGQGVVDGVYGLSDSAAFWYAWIDELHVFPSEYIPAADMKVFVRERLNGYYGVSQFTVSNTVASLPFIFLIAVVSTVCVYFISNLRTEGDSVIYFILNLFCALTVVESLIMAIAPLVPHYLMVIAAGAGIMGFFMIVCGFFQPLNSMPKVRCVAAAACNVSAPAAGACGPHAQLTCLALRCNPRPSLPPPACLPACPALQPIFRYPLSYMAYHTYSFTGFMRNQFEGTAGWGCPNGQPAGSVGCLEGLTGQDVLAYYEIMDINKWVCLAILIGMGFL